MGRSRADDRGGVVCQEQRILDLLVESSISEERDEICLEKDSVESNMKPRFLADRLRIVGLVEGREREGGLTILEVC